VLEPVDAVFSFRDLRAAREARRLLSCGFGPAEIVAASTELARVGRGLFDTSIADAPWGDLMQRVGGRIGRLTGQYELALDEDYESLDGIFARAEDAEVRRDRAEAERLYRIALRMDAWDPVIPFNLGNVLDAAGRTQEAALSYQHAIARDPTFAEAWVNLAVLQERDGRSSDAEVSLRRALHSRPDMDAALFNLARLLTNTSRHQEALPLWERYLALAEAENRGLASKMRALCRLTAAPA
jgi:tetratricopeptide (TPR) repeat protein